MAFNKNILLVLAFCSVFGVTLAQSKCKKCQDNLAYCVDETHFYLCMDGDRPSITDDPHECPVGTFCTNSPDICAAEDQQGGITKSCASSGDCNKCNNRKLTCVSTTEFAICNSENKPSVISSCDEGQVCSVDLFDDPNTNKICAPEAVLQYLEYSVTCSNAQASTVSPPSSSTVGEEARKTQCLEAQENGETARFFYIKNKDDNTCRSYIYCEQVNNNMVAILFTCKTGYYDGTAKKCVDKKPKDC